MLNQVEVLLVEDNMHDAEMTIRSLKKVNLANNLVHVKDGEEALDYVFCRGTHAGRKAVGPSLILLDLKLPKIDGLQVLRAIKADPRTKGIPVVILTSFRAERDRTVMVGDSLLNTEEAARFLRVSEASIRRWSDAGLLPARRVGRRREPAQAGPA